jgi:hypothetical protein
MGHCSAGNKGVKMVLNLHFTNWNLAVFVVCKYWRLIGLVMLQKCRNTSTPTRSLEKKSIWTLFKNKRRGEVFHAGNETTYEGLDENDYMPINQINTEFASQLLDYCHVADCFLKKGKKTELHAYLTTYCLHSENSHVKFYRPFTSTVSFILQPASPM